MWCQVLKDNTGSAVWVLRLQNPSFPCPSFGCSVSRPCSETAESFLSSSKLQVQPSDIWCSWLAVPMLQSLSLHNVLPVSVLVALRQWLPHQAHPQGPNPTLPDTEGWGQHFLGTQFNCTFIFICIKKMPILVHFLKFWGFKHLDKLLLMLQFH